MSLTCITFFYFSHFLSRCLWTLFSPAFSEAVCRWERDKLVVCAGKDLETFCRRGVRDGFFFSPRSHSESHQRRSCYVVGWLWALSLCGAGELLQRAIGVLEQRARSGSAMPLHNLKVGKRGN